MPPLPPVPPQPQHHVTPEEAIDIGLAHHRGGNLQEAEAVYRKVLAAAPDHPAALHWLGVVARQTGHKDDELALLLRSIEINPNDPLTRQDLGETFASRGQLEEAEKHYLAGVTLQPDSAAILNDLAVVYHKQRKYADALATVDRALAINPDLPQGHGNRGMALTDLGRFDEAIAELDESLRIRPGHHATLLSKARALFLSGDLRPAFELYEVRFQCGEIPYPKFNEPMWDGKSDVAGKTVLIVTEQGAGDTIQFARYAPLLAQERGANVILLCTNDVKPLLQSLGGGVQILGSGEGRPRFDCHVPILSLPRILGTTLASVPGRVPYLAADAERVEKWRRRLADEKRPKVGLAWAGSASHKSDRNRSLPLKSLAPLMSDDIAWFSLQKGPPAQQLADPSGAKLVDLAPDLHDYADTAAAVEALDLVISVDTSVAHVAGALARPVWMPLSYEGEWRWMRGRDDSPWYPTLRLFRQPTPGDWTSVIARIGEELRQKFARGRDMSNHEASTQGWQRLNEGRYDDARRMFDEVLASDANYAAALHGAGFLAYLQGRGNEALDLLSRAVRADPKLAEAYLHLAVCHHAAGRLDAAVDALRRAIQVDSKRATYHAGLGALLHARGELPAAIESYRRAMHLEPDDANTLVNLAHLLVETDRPDEAEPIARRAVAAQPMQPLAHYKLGVALERLGRGDEAIPAMRSLALDPNSGDAHAGLGMMLLRAGRMKRGWSEHEWRFAAKNDPASMPELDSPRWNGSPMPGKRLLLQGEQGLGDTIQFARFASTAVQRFGGRVGLRCDDRLVELMRTLAPSIEITGFDTPAPEHDVHAPLMSLPHLLGIEDLQTPGRYLKADPQRVARLASRLGEHPRPRVGITWAGNPAHGNDRRRSIDPQLLSPLAEVKGVSWFSLQREARTLPPLPIVEWSAELDMSDTAALMSELDLVIAVDTAKAHLAGALGRSVWTLLPFVADWRWFTAPDDSPWYATMRLFRQPTRGDWNAVIARVARELGELRGS